MEEFLNDYVKMLAESSEVSLTQTQLQTIVNNIMNNEVVWEVMDEHIRYEFEELNSTVSEKDLAKELYGVDNDCEYTPNVKEED